MLVLNRADGSVLSRSLASCSANSPEEIVQEPQHCLLRIVHSLKHCCRQEQEVSLLPLQGLSWQEHCQAPELAAAARACWYQALFGGRSAVPLAAEPKTTPAPPALSPDPGRVHLHQACVSQPQALLHQQSSAGGGGALISSNISPSSEPHAAPASVQVKFFTWTGTKFCSLRPGERTDPGSGTPCTGWHFHRFTLLTAACP